MRPYGIPRIANLEHLDVADVRRFGLKSAVGCIQKKNGEYHGLCRPGAKAKVRRHWARQARTQGKVEIRKAIQE